MCIPLQKKEWLHKFSSWPGDAHIIFWKVHKPVCFVSSFVGLLMQPLKQKAARKHLNNQSCQYVTVEDSLVKVLAPNVMCPNVMCPRQFPFSYVCLTCQLHTTPSKEYMSAVPLQCTSILLKPCIIYCKSSPT